MPMALKIVTKSTHSLSVRAGKVGGDSDELKKLRNEMTMLRRLDHVSARVVRRPILLDLAMCYPLHVLGRRHSQLVHCHGVRGTR